MPLIADVAKTFENKLDPLNRTIVEADTTTRSAKSFFYKRIHDYNHYLTNQTNGLPDEPQSPNNSHIR